MSILYKVANSICVATDIQRKIKDIKHIDTYNKYCNEKSLICVGGMQEEKKTKGQASWSEI